MVVFPAGGGRLTYLGRGLVFPLYECFVFGDFKKKGVRKIDSLESYFPR
tara:strand:- start:1445 stop:1591 length:147 start_codon:yes stop_codon:yes gene_type:complete